MGTKREPKTKNRERKELYAISVHNCTYNALVRQGATKCHFQFLSLITSYRHLFFDRSPLCEYLLSVNIQIVLGCRGSQYRVGAGRSTRI